MGWLFFDKSIIASFTNVALSTYIVAVVIILCVVRYRGKIQEYLAYRRTMIDCAKTLPGPTTLPIVGNGHQFRDTDKTVFILAEMSRQFNASSYRVWFGPLLKICITDPRDYEILMKSPKAAEKAWLYKFLEPAVINSLINGSGPTYRAHKKLVVPLINGSNLLTEHIKEFNRQTKIMVKNMAKHVDGGEFDIHHNIVPCVADIVYETIYGEPGNCQSGSYNILVEVSETVLHILWSRIMAVWLWPDVMFNLTSRAKVVNKMINGIHNMLDEMVAKKQAEFAKLISQGIEPDLKKSAVLDQIIAHVAKTNSWSKEELRYECLTLFIGSHDTIAGVSCFVSLMLALFPDIQQKVRNEINDVLGDSDMTEDHATNLKYLDMVIRETIRFFPVGPLLPRHITGDIKLTNCTLPKGATVFMLPVATFKDPKYWDEPEKFNPERFNPENSQGRHPWTFIPFSGGLRSCPGSKYGMICIKAIIGEIVRHYQLSTSLQLDKLNIHSHISTRCVDGYRISLSKLKQ